MITPNFHFKNFGTILINKTFAGPIRTLQTKTLYSQTQWSHFHAPKNKTWWTRLPVVSRKKNANSTCERFGSSFGLIHGRGKYGMNMVGYKKDGRGKVRFLPKKVPLFC